MIDLDIHLRRDAFELDVSLRSDAGAVALFGPSGSGKTSTLMAVAGLLRPQRGHITLADRCLYDSSRNIDLPAHARRLGMAFQDLRLFPHLNVRGNLLYGRRNPRQRDAADVDATVELLGLGALLERRPSALSGGEARRVAMGRALLAQPAALLLDEPLTGLHRQARDEVLAYLHRLKTGVRVPLLLVSHQADEVAALADEVALIADGRVSEQIAIAEFAMRQRQVGAEPHPAT